MRDPEFEYSATAPCSLLPRVWYREGICFFMHYQSPGTMDPYITALFEKETSSEPESSPPVGHAGCSQLFLMAVMLTELSMDRRGLAVWELSEITVMIKRGHQDKRLGRSMQM